MKDFFNYLRVRKGARELQTNGKLHGKPAIIIHGREDALVIPNFQSRACYALNQIVERRKSNLRYWEVTPAQHFEAFIYIFQESLRDSKVKKRSGVNFPRPTVLRHLEQHHLLPHQLSRRC
jgi:hypothetical protein